MSCGLGLAAADVNGGGADFLFEIAVGVADIDPDPAPGEDPGTDPAADPDAAPTPDLAPSFGRYVAAEGVNEVAGVLELETAVLLPMSWAPAEALEGSSVWCEAGGGDGFTRLAEGGLY